MPRRLWHALSDLLLPTTCAGCAATASALTFEVCGACRQALTGLRAFATKPDPQPPGLPACVALGEYGGPLREVLLAYKERGRHRLSRPLGALLAEAIGVAVGPTAQLMLLYVPDTPAAARQRHGDHMKRLAGAAAARLRSAGLRVRVASPLRARARPDSAGLDAVSRARAAAGGFTVRPGEAGRVRAEQVGMPVLLLDDIITTGVTLAAGVGRLAEFGVRVDGCVTLAATQRWGRDAVRPRPGETHRTSVQTNDDAGLSSG